MEVRGPGVDVRIVASPPQDKGTARCRLSVPTLISLDVRPGDPIIALPHDSEYAYLCCACAHTCSDAFGGVKDGKEACVDRSFELPLSLLPSSLTSTSSTSGRVVALARNKGDMGGGGHMRVGLAMAKVVELKCIQEMDPPAWVRVEVGKAVSRNVVVAGVMFHVPDLGRVRVESTTPGGPVRVSGATRVSFVAPPSSQPSTPLPSSSVPRSPAPSTPSHVSTPMSSTPQPSTPSSSIPQTPGASPIVQIQRGSRLRIPFCQACPSPRAPNLRQPTSAAPRRIEDSFKGYSSVVCRLREAAWVIFSAHTNNVELAWAKQGSSKLENNNDKQETDVLGIRPSMGLILYGPPGTGRSTLVRALAEETSAQYIEIMPHHVYGVGQGEAVLRDAFASSETSGVSTLLHLRELDKLCPKRLAGREREARVVAQLLSLMDGARGRRGGRLMVIGTTSRPSAVDEALRRPGRFDQEMSLSDPSLSDRVDIIKHCAASMPLSPHVDLEVVAGQCVGFSGAELLTLCRQAASAAVSRTLCREIKGGPGKTARSTDGDDDDLALKLGEMGLGEAAVVDVCDWEVAVGKASAAGLRGVQTGFEPLSLDSVGGLESVKSKLRQAIEWPLLKADKFTHMGVRASRGVLLYGVPGCGKTSLVRAVATLCCVGFLKANGAELYSAYLGESERILSALFHRARSMRPCIVFLDELDAIVGKRSLDGSGDGGGEAAGVQQRVLSTLLNEMDGIEGAEGVVVVAATNRLDMIDAALTRPGRFDHIIEVPLPDAVGRRDILQKGFKSGLLRADVDLERVAQLAEGFTGAELERLCMEASMSALRNKIRRDNSGVTAQSAGPAISLEATSQTEQRNIGSGPCITAADISYALNTLRPASLRGDFRSFE